MGCLLPLIAVFMPRLALVLIFLFTQWFALGYRTVVWPVLGFIFMPYTTLAWMAAMIHGNHQLGPVWMGVVIVAVILDLGGQGHSARRRLRRRR